MAVSQSHASPAWSYRGNQPGLLRRGTNYCISVPQSKSSRVAADTGRLITGGLVERHYRSARNRGDHWEELLSSSTCIRSKIQSSVETARQNGNSVLTALHGSNNGTLEEGKGMPPLQSKSVGSEGSPRKQQLVSPTRPQVVPVAPTGRQPPHTRPLGGRRMSRSSLENAELADDEGASKGQGPRRLSLNPYGSQTGKLDSNRSGASELSRSTVRDLLGTGSTRNQRQGAEVGAEGADCVSGNHAFKYKSKARRFDAKLCCFRDLVNNTVIPTFLGDALERLEPFVGGDNFKWERSQGHGGSLILNTELVMWYKNDTLPDVKTGAYTTVSFLHKPGCAYIFQPVLPVTSLAICPKSTYKPMFEMDPRSFHAFKLAWRHYLDFGSSDYRIIVGEQLEQWANRCKAVIETPMNAVYWLMLMAASVYRETLVKRSVLKGFEDSFERVPVICVDSFVALSALLFSPERQVLYAGTDPTPSYLQWLQYVADQHSSRKDGRDHAATVFERNEFLDLSVIIVFYGRIQQKVKESAKMSWVGNPELIKKHIAKYAEDNLCASQIDQAVRLYTYSCSVGNHKTGAQGETWQCWNGLDICEIGVPLPSTRATFLSPFVTTKPIALLCPQHGPDAARIAAEREAEKDAAKKRKAAEKKRLEEGDADETIFGARGSDTHANDIKDHRASISANFQKWQIQEQDLQSLDVRTQRCEKGVDSNGASLNSLIADFATTTQKIALNSNRVNLAHGCLRGMTKGISEAQKRAGDGLEGMISPEKLRGPEENRLPGLPGSPPRRPATSMT